MAAGFTGFAITWRGEVYEGAVQASSAKQFGTMGVNFRARKAVDEDEWMVAINDLTCRV